GSVALSDRGLKLTDEQKLDWLRLIRSDNIGPHPCREWINHCGRAGEALKALPGLNRRGGGRDIRIFSREDAAREFAAIKAHGATVIALGEALYPPRLAAIDDPPPLLIARGKLDVLLQPMIAVVGSRNASAAGIKFA